MWKREREQERKGATWQLGERSIDYETVVYTHNGILLSHKEEQKYFICRKKDRTKDYAK